jgi:predicted alpha/beta-hydrolase family hydrolase
VSVHEVVTDQGPARVHLREPTGEPVGRLVLGHGAGGGLGAPDLVAARAAAVAEGWAVALVEQPWKVAGRRVAGRPPTLDAAWLEVIGALEGIPGIGGIAGPLVVGGRSAGARVACRTAAQTGADGVLCLAFPLHLPGKPEKSRADELNAPTVPVLVVQGETDPFGGPDEIDAALAVRPDAASRALVTLVRMPGNHSLTTTGRRVDPSVDPAVRAWLAAVSGR